MPKRVAYLFALVLFLFFHQTVFAANLLSNADFEDGINNWSKYGGDLQVTSSPVNNGSSAAKFISSTQSTKWIYQIIPVTGGLAYAFSGYVLKNDNNIASILLRVAWYSSSNGSGSELSHNDSTITLTENNSSYQLLSTEAIIAPDAANSARVKGVAAFSSTTQTIAYFDNFTFEQVPMPTPSPSPTPAPTSTNQTSSTKSPTPTPKPSAAVAKSTPISTPSQVLGNKTEEQLLLASTPEASPIQSTSSEEQKGSSKTKIAAMLTGSGVTLIGLSIGFFVLYNKTLNKEHNKEEGKDIN